MVWLRFYDHRLILGPGWPQAYRSEHQHLRHVLYYMALTDEEWFTVEEFSAL